MDNKEQDEYNNNEIIFAIILLIIINEILYCRGPNIIESVSIDCLDIEEPRSYIDKYIDNKITLLDICKKFDMTIENTNYIKDECVLCYHDNENQIIAKCNHNYCAYCLFMLMNKNFLKNGCIYCNTEINLNECRVTFVKD